MTTQITTQAAHAAAAAGFELVATGDGLVLRGEGLELRGDFSDMIGRIKSGRFGQEQLVKAVRIKGHEGTLRVVDATAGLGEDSLILAAAGFEVTLFERDPVIAALLADTMARAASDDILAPAIERMSLRCQDSIEGLQALGLEPDVVLLDPMFPAKQKNAKTKKKLQLFQKLESPCEDEQALMDAALAANPRKIVVKRPLKGPYLAERKPSYSLDGKTIRYDCIVIPR